MEDSVSNHLTDWVNLINEQNNPKEEIMIGCMDLKENLLQRGLDFSHMKKNYICEN